MSGFEFSFMPQMQPPFELGKRQRRLDRKGGQRAADVWPIRGPALADDPAGKQAYAEPIDAQVSRLMRRDAPVRRPAAVSCNHHVSVR